MELYNRNEDGRCEEAPIRGSFFILISKLFIMLLIFEFIYGTIYYILTLGIPLPFDLHHHIAELILFLQILKVFIQLFLILDITLSWSNSIYYIHSNGKHLIKRAGVINIKEDVYEIDTVRSITVDQSWMGRIFHYGDLLLKTSASGGYQVLVTMMSIQNPQKYEEMIRKYL